MKTEHNHNIDQAHSLTPGNAQQHIEFYDAQAVDYDYRYGKGNWACPTEVAKTAANFLGADKLVADVGCGTGLLGAALASNGYKAIHGVDISPGMLERAIAKNVYAVTYLHDIFAAPLKTEYVGIVMSGAMTIGHMDRRMMPNICSSLSEGGYFIFSAPCTHEHTANYIGNDISNQDFMRQSGIRDWIDNCLELELIQVTPSYSSMRFSDQVLFHRNYVCRKRSA